MDDRKRLFWHQLLVLGAVLLFAVIFFLLMIRGGDDLDAEFRYRELGDGTIAVEGYTGTTKKLTIPESIDGKTVSQIYARAFAYSEELKSVTVPASVREIGEDAFYECGKLREVKIEGALEVIGRSAFSGCSYLRKINLPEGLIQIDKEAFTGCTRLPSLKIPASCTTIGDDVFLACETLVLDCSENPVAEEYAAKYEIPTGFEDSGSEFYLKLAGAVLIPTLILAIALILWRRFRKPKGEA